MTLKHTDIEKIAKLARLELGAEEIPLYVGSLSRILAFVGELDQADTGDLKPMAHPLAGLAQRLRPDEVREVDRHAEFQRNAPEVEAGLYLVPRVIE